MTLLYVNDRIVDLKPDQVVAYNLKGIAIGNITSRWANITNRFIATESENNAITFTFSGSEKSTGTAPYRILPSKLVQNGVEFLGSCIVQNFKSGYQLLFIDDSFDYFNPLKGKSLSEIMPITDSPWTEEEMDSNRASTSGLISAIVWWGTGVDIFDPNLYLPSFYYHTLVRKVFEFVGLTPSGSILTDTGFTDLIVPFPSATFTRLNAVDAPIFDSKGAFAATTGGSFNFSYPSNVTAGNLLFLHVVSYGLGTITVDASWTSLGSLTYPTMVPVFVSRLYYKIADGTETGAENVSRSGHAGTDVFMGQVYQYQGDQYGVDLNISVEDSDNQNGNAATITWAATSVGGGKRTLAAFVTNIGGSAPATPSGYSESATDNDGSNNYLDLNTKTDTNSGASTTASGGSANGWITWHVSITNTKQNVDWNQYFNEIKADALLKDFFNRFGILFNISGTTIELKTIQAIISDRAGAVDWSEKLVKSKPELDFSLKDYAQSNMFRYTDSEFVNDYTLGQGSLDIDNDTLKAEQEKYLTFFENSRTENTTGHLVARIPVYDSTSEISDDIVEAPGIKLLTLKSRTSEPAITFDQTARTDYKLGYFLDDALAKDTGFQYFLDTYYSSFTEALQLFKQTSKYFYLTELDVYNFNRLKMIWDGDGYYLIDEIKNYIPGKITKVVLFKVS
jgi:hypothetical protein